MAGSPIISGHAELLELYGEEGVMELRMAGGTWRSIREVVTNWAMATMGAECLDRLDVKKIGCRVIGDAGLQRFLHADDSGAGRKDGRRWLRWQECTRMAAEALVGEAREIVDAAPETNAGVSKAKARAEQRRWEASKLDREQYGEAPPVSLTLNTGDLHLQALRQFRAVPLVEAGELVVEPLQLEAGDGGRD